MNQIKRKDKIGMTIFNKQGTKMKIVNHISKDRFLIEFQDEYKFQTDVFYQNFIRGTVKNPYDKTICDIGYIGVGKHGTTELNGKLTRIYVTWHDMIVRCYKEDIRHLHPAYKDCFVCDEWHCFQNFADWYETNYYTIGKGRMHLDKDILIEDNKLYSPDTCIFVPQRINMIFMSKPNKYNLPCGISLNEGKYQTFYNNIYLGVFKTLKEAMINYNEEKIVHIREVAEEYKHSIPKTLYNALYSFNGNML